MLLFLKKRHIKINEDFLAEHAKYFRNSLVLYSVKEASEPEYLLAILDDAISLKVINEEGKTKYRTIKDYKIDNYKYGYHHIKK